MEMMTYQLVIAPISDYLTSLVESSMMIAGCWLIAPKINLVAQPSQILGKIQ